MAFNTQYLASGFSNAQPFVEVGEVGFSTGSLSMTAGDFYIVTLSGYVYYSSGDPNDLYSYINTPAWGSLSVLSYYADGYYTSVTAKVTANSTGSGRYITGAVGQFGGYYTVISGWDATRITGSYSDVKAIGYGSGTWSGTNTTNVVTTYSNTPSDCFIIVRRDSYLVDGNFILINQAGDIDQVVQNTYQGNRVFQSAVTLSRTTNGTRTLHVGGPGTGSANYNWVYYELGLPATPSGPTAYGPSIRR